ncbi:putative transcriptional regulator, TetR family [Rhodopseudomonas palustris HaA2]|uniref:Putative transcriptional regulator, TetR family n=1 Tax=Rhodopseudomonas palustris (strain HaA2) TaxID=316058 RepID=Q2IWU1_RHOP2|nr:TetR family transcriptional regulator [Rhodopseudomonas palustris]ABD07319.1 putative transcriptional regulator, TetR family [Rhodopseudomonas palustris HaA2]
MIEGEAAVNSMDRIDFEASDRERPVMEATLRLIGRGGLKGVTHRAVAAETGLSLGAITHHFGTRDLLVEAALKFALMREVRRLRALALSLQSDALDVEAWIDALVGWYTKELDSDAEIHIACYEAFLAAARDDRYRPIVAEWYETWRRSAELALTAAGSSRPQLHAEIFVSALVGIVLQQLAAPRRKFRAETRAALSELMRGLIGRT